MAKKPATKPVPTPKAAPADSGPSANLQRPAAEVLYAAELDKLADRDKAQPKPKGWKLTPRSVLSFVLGDDDLNLAPKFVGSRAFLERAIVALATNRGLMLIGEPGTAKSYLSELLAAGISGDSTLTVQGSAGTTEDNIKYSWNYALLLAEGPSERSLVPAPVYRGMREGKIVRFEEITRCPIEIQDTLLSVLSDRVLAIPELDGPERSLFAQSGFNVIATANTRDRGVNDMSAALKRRFNFETVQPISSIEDEMALVTREAGKMLARAAIPVSLQADVVEVLVTTFHELRHGKTGDGKALEPLTTAMSTAEAVSCAYAAGIHAYYYGGGEVEPAHLVQHLVGAALKDAPDDVKKLAGYFNHVVKGRKRGAWPAYYEARKHLP
jgi:MoxR-like ATPase